MKKFVLLALSWVSIVSAMPTSNFIANYTNEILCEQKQSLARSSLSAPAPTGYVPFVITNNSNVADTNIYILILANTFTQIITFTQNASNQWVGALTTPPTATYVSQAGSGTYTLNSFLDSTSGTYTFYLPSTVNLTSSRIYYSIGNPLDWFIPASGPVQVPIQDFADPSQDGYYILFDKQEFTMVANDRLIVNPTLVDYYGLPLSFSISSNQGTSYAGLPPTLSSSTIFANYVTAYGTLPTSPGAGVQSKWKSLYFTYKNPSGSTTGPLRVLAPSQGIQTTSTQLSSVPLFPVNYFLGNSYITCNWLTQVWNTFYVANTLWIDLSTSGPSYGVASGTVSGGTFTFTAITGTGTGSTLVLPLPTTSKPFFTSALSDYPGQSSTGDPNVAAAIWQALSAGIMAGVIPYTGNSQSNPLSQSFIQSQTLFANNAYLTALPCAGPWYDFYSGTFIGMGTGNYTQFYTTPYGDYLGTSGTTTITGIQNAGAVVTVNIADMTGIHIPNPFDDTNSYSVTFATLPSNISATFGSNPQFGQNATVTNGQPPVVINGNQMYLGVTYQAGPYTNVLWGTQLIPSGQACKPILPGGMISCRMTLTGSNLVVTLGASPSN
jgi:hypothetical protein